MYKVTYDDESNAMYILLKKKHGQINTSLLGHATVNMDIDVFGNIIGFELLFRDKLRVNNKTNILLY